MKGEHFNKLRDLAEIREMTASTRLEAAHRELREETEALAQAKESYQVVKVEGRQEVSDFMKNITDHQGYSSALTRLRAVNARVNSDIEEAADFINVKKQCVADAELNLDHCRNEYREARQKLEKLNILSEKIISEENKMLQLAQEADVIDNNKINGRRF